MRFSAPRDGSYARVSEARNRDPLGSHPGGGVEIYPFGLDAPIITTEECQ